MNTGEFHEQLLLALVITTLVSACATTTSPTGRRQMVGGVSQAQLDQLGAQAFAETKQKEKISTDGRQNGYVQCVVNALVAQLPAQYRGVRWETAVFVDKEPNAFALPGGKVGVNTGIFTVAKNQDQLAAVIGHESVMSSPATTKSASPARWVRRPGWPCSARWLAQPTAKVLPAPSTSSVAWARRLPSCCRARGRRKRG